MALILDGELLDELTRRADLLKFNGSLLMPARRWGKSFAVQTEARVSGKAADRVLLDDPIAPSNDLLTKPLPKSGPIFAMRDTRFPAADVEIVQRTQNRHDPRNPNPGAPPTRLFYITVAGRISDRGYSALQLAKVQAEIVHQTLVTRLLEEERRSKPNFGRFA